jgi:hypothetical protein
MTADEALDCVAEAQALLEKVRDAFPCGRCDGDGEDYPGHHYSPCYECDGTGYQIPDETEGGE